MSHTARTDSPPAIATTRNGGVNINPWRMLPLLLGLLALAGAVGSYYVQSYRVENHEARLNKLEDVVAAQRELLVRIDENVKQLRREERVRSP